MSLVTISRDLARAVGGFSFAPPVTAVLNPLVYARRPHEAWLRRYGAAPKEVLLVGMNPGPWGMAQTGVPFGDVVMVRDWMGIEAAVDRPVGEHPKRPVLGFACPRREVSGTRLWSWARARYGPAERFFERFFVWNHCPLAFLEDSGRNRTPDKLPASERTPLLAACDEALARVVRHLSPRIVLGVGVYAEACARRALGDEVSVGRVLHPSPASPAANRGWAEQMDRALAALGIS